MEGVAEGAPGGRGGREGGKGGGGVRACDRGYVRI